MESFLFVMTYDFPHLVGSLLIAFSAEEVLSRSENVCHWSTWGTLAILLLRVAPLRATAREVHPF